MDSGIVTLEIHLSGIVLQICMDNVGCLRASEEEFIPGNEQKVNCYPCMKAGAEGANLWFVIW